MAVDGGYAADGLADMLRRFLKRFPLDLPDDEELAEEHLAAVDDDAADSEVEEPDSTKMSPEEFKIAEESVRVRQDRFVFKQAQIKCWMAYQYRKDHDLDATESGMYNQYCVLMAKLTNKSLDRPRLKTAVNVWRKSQRTAIEAECQKIVAAAKEQPQTGGKSELLIAMRSRIAAAMFAKLPKEERGFWELEALAEHEVALAKWKEDEKAPVPTDPAACKRCIQGLIHFVQPILDLISKATGWKASMIAGGPEPAQGGQLNIISVHSGSTTGNVKMNFGRAERVRFRSTVVPLYGSFLRKCYTPDECRARALPKEEGYIPMVDQDLDNEAASCDTVTWEASSTSGASSRAGTPALLGDNPLDPLKAAKDMLGLAAASSQHTSCAAKKARSTATNKSMASTLSNVPPAVSASSNIGANPGPHSTLAASVAKLNADTNPPPLSVAAASYVNAHPVANATSGVASTPRPPLMPAASNTPPSSHPPSMLVASNVTLTPPVPVEDLNNPASRTSLGNGDATDGNPFPFILEGTPRPSPPPSLPPSPAHSPQPVHMELPVAPGHPTTTDAKTIEIDAGVGAKAVTDGAEPMDVDSGSESRAEEVGGDAMDAMEADKGRKSQAVDDKVGSVPNRRSGHASKTAASPTEAERAGEEKGKKRGVEEPTLGTDGLSNGNQAKKPRTSRALATTPSVQPLKSPSIAPAWFSKSMAMFASAELGADWKGLLGHWATFEASANYTSSTNLSAAQRPTVVKDWIQRARSTTWRPCIANTDQFGRQFMLWWTALQPEWRKRGEGVGGIAGAGCTGGGLGGRREERGKWTTERRRRPLSLGPGSR